MTAMRIAVISDTHSRYRTVAKVAELLRQQSVDVVLHCGDIEDAETVRMLAGLPIHYVFGNCDIDGDALRLAMKESGATLHEQWGALELAGKKIAWTHGDDLRLFRDLENGGRFDFLFYGHTHRAAQHRTGKTLVVNPGALQRARIKTFAILNLKTSEIESIVAEPAEA
jgi:putative phosphoesterase